jgi:hypothetical protein
MSWPKATGILLLTFPVLIQIPYTMLITGFDYPDILRQPAAVILERYAAGAAAGPLIATWYAFAIAIVPLLVGICMLPASLPDHARSPWLRAATPLGIASALLQIAGLLRWVVLVPLLAASWATSTGDPGTRKSIELIFEAQHQLFGVLLGEHLGQLLLGLWTLGIALGFPAVTKAAQWQRGLGLLAGGLFIAGSPGSLAATFPALAPLDPLATVAFLIWSVWCCLLGLVLIRLPAAPPSAASGIEPASSRTSGGNSDAAHSAPRSPAETKYP